MGMLAQILATFEMPLKAIWLSKVRELLAGRRVSLLRNILAILGWWHSTVVERRSLTGELSLSCARPAADG